MNKKLFILLPTIIVILGAYWFVSTQDWRGNDNLKYTNTKYDYSFQYSPNWNLMGDSQSDVIMLYNTETPPGDGGVPVGIKVDVMILDNYENLNLEAWVGQLSQEGFNQEVLTEENITVDGIKAIRRTTSPVFVELDEGAPISVYFMKENNIIMINYLGREPDYSMEIGNFELILESFNFD